MKRRRGPRYTVKVRPGVRGGIEKRCVKCLLWKPLVKGFYAHACGAFGRCNHCKLCERARKLEAMRVRRPDLYAMTAEERRLKRQGNLLRGSMKRAA